MFYDYKLKETQTITLSKELYDKMLKLIDDGFYSNQGYFPIGCNIICGAEQPKGKQKSAEEIIQSKKNKKPFYKKFDRLKKWEQ